MERVQKFIVPLGNDRPLHLERRGEFPTLDGQVALQQGPLLDRFPAVELGVEFADVLLDQVAHFLKRGQLVV